MKHAVGFIDRIMGMLSMYLGVVLSLFTLIGIAFALSILGALPFTPVEVIVSAAIFILSALTASYTLGYLFAVPAHHISSIITGAILFFIFSPTTSLSSLLLYALIALIAIASKYLLVWRGRHLFNPAAIAAVVIALTGLQAASWWGAGTALAIPVALFGVVVLYKTQRLLLGGIFLAVYFATVAITSGQEISQLPVVFSAWLPFFFVGFMLSEPLTQPPRRWQWMTYAGLTALLIGLHPSIGGVYMTPEIALVIANLLSALAARRVGIQLKLVNRRKYAGNQEEFEFMPLRRLSFTAGQYMEMTVPHKNVDLRGERRFFTIASSPRASTIRVITRYAEKSSTFKRQLAALQKGDVVTATGIRGDFVLSANRSRKLLLIAGGIGVTPFRAFAEDLELRNEERDVVFIHAVRSKKETLFVEVLKRFRMIILAPDAGSKKGEIRAERLTSAVIQEAVPDLLERDVFISGSPAMVASLKEEVRRLGVKHIYTDDFTGY